MQNYHYMFKLTVMHNLPLFADNITADKKFVIKEQNIK